MRLMEGVVGDGPGRLDPSVVLDRAKSGEVISRGELDELARGLADPADPRDKYLMIYALGRASLDPRYADVIRPFLNSPQDPRLARVTVQMLSNAMGQEESIREDLLAFARGVAWDDDDDVRMVALSSAGNWLRSLAHEHRWDDDLFTVLHSTAVEDPDDLIREVAVGSLARALGWEHRDIIAAGRKSWQEFVDTILTQAGERLPRD